MTDRARGRRWRARGWAIAAAIVLTALYAYLLAPILIAVALSFSSASTFEFPPPGWSLEWYVALLDNQDFREGLILSLQIALVATAVALVCGVSLAIAATRGEFPGRRHVLNFVTVPLIVPTVAIGLGMLLVAAPLGLQGSLPLIVASHALLMTPFVAHIVATAIRAIPPELEEAAISLGATPIARFRRVLLPLLLPSIAAAAAVSLTISIGETQITLFIVGSESTLPIVMFRYLTRRTDPQLAALSVVMLGFTLLAVVVVQQGLQRWNARRLA